MSEIVKVQTRTNLFGKSAAVGAKIDRETLAHVLKKELQSMTLEQFVGLFTNPFEQILEYAALVEGKNTCQNLSLLFNPHRLDTPTYKSSTIFRAINEIDSYATGLARATLFQKKNKTAITMDRAVQIGINGVQYVNEFPPHVMRDLCRRYGLGPTSSVLDPCAGWGGRMIGASVVVGHYTAFEPNTRTYEGLRKLRRFLRGFRSDFKATLYHIPYEDAELETGLYDFALTSPPYYDTEHYSPEDTNSLNRYPTFEKWCVGFYVPLIRKTMAALRPGAPFIFNIGSRRYPLNEVMKDTFGKELSIKSLDQSHLICRTTGLNKKGEGETFYELRAK